MLDHFTFPLAAYVSSMFPHTLNNSQQCKTGKLYNILFKCKIL